MFEKRSFGSFFGGIVHADFGAVVQCVGQVQSRTAKLGLNLILCSGAISRLITQANDALP
ncbi:hypothetical protein AOA57_11795 [Pseudomonas sp. 2588-5]|nr:hypothetical protein B1R45_07760 [Pseudomonas azotoformans]PIB49182.1 hypothetical protein AOA57_11795 [Pseudomonas sp. 2588-5]